MKFYCTWQFSKIYLISVLFSSLTRVNWQKIYVIYICIMSWHACSWYFDMLRSYYHRCHLIEWASFSHFAYITVVSLSKHFISPNFWFLSFVSYLRFSSSKYTMYINWEVMKLCHSVMLRFPLKFNFMYLCHAAITGPAFSPFLSAENQAESFDSLQSNF